MARIRHDESAKRLFAHRRMVADLVRLLGEDWVEDLDLDRLERLPAEHVADGLRARRADMPWWAPFKPGAGRPAGAGVLIHVEFQSSPDPWMAERLSEYIVLLRRDLRRSGWRAADGGRGRGACAGGGVQRPGPVERAAAAGRVRLGTGIARPAAAPGVPAG